MTIKLTAILFLVVLALCLFFLAMIGVQSTKYNLIAGGLFCLTLAGLLGGRVV